MTKILIVDDEPSIRNLIAAYLKAEGYTVYTISDGLSVINTTREIKPDLIILDIMLPGMDGLDVLTRLRHESNVYVILLTAKTEETDKIIGLSIGADDYLTKPFSPRELTARVKSALRRLQKDELQNPESEVLKFKQIIIDVDAHRVLVNGISIQLTATEFTILLLLARNRGRVLTREQILESLWGYGFIGDTRVIDVHLGHIRQKIGDGLISTVRGLGYLFEDEAV